MLILTRQIQQSITIDEKTIVTILDIDRGRVKLGITGPAHITRTELLEVPANFLPKL